MSTLPAGVQIVGAAPSQPQRARIAGDRRRRERCRARRRPTKEALAQAGTHPRRSRARPLLKDRSDLDYLRVFASRPPWSARRSAISTCPARKPSVVIQVRRGDADIQPRPDLVLEFGDRIGLLAHRGDFTALRKYFGDSIKTTAEFSYISIGIGMALGFLIGAIQVPLPGIGKLSVGLSGVLIVALILGNLRRTGRHELDDSALRQPRHAQPRAHAVPRAGRHGLRAQVRRDGHRDRLHDARPGRDRAASRSSLPILLLGLWVFRMPFDEVAGIVSGACGNPAILAYANKLAPTDRPDIGYAMIFPGMTIVKILFVDIVPALFEIAATQGPDPDQTFSSSLRWRKYAAAAACIGGLRPVHA